MPNDRSTPAAPLSGREAESPLDHVEHLAMIVHQVDGGRGPHRVAAVEPLVLQLTLAELRAGRIPGELRQLDLVLGLDLSPAEIAADVGAGLGLQVGLCRIGQY